MCDYARSKKCYNYDRKFEFRVFSDNFPLQASIEQMSSKVISRSIVMRNLDREGGGITTAESRNEKRNKVKSSVFQRGGKEGLRRRHRYNGQGLIWSRLVWI